MKIDSPKFASAPRTAERPQLTKPAAGNTGIVPSTPRKPEGNTGIVPTTAAKTGSTSTYQMPPNLEPYRPVFDKLGSKIARLPTEELRQAAIDRSATKLSKRLGGIATLDEIKSTLSNAVSYFRSGPTNTNDPQCFASSRSNSKDVFGSGGFSARPPSNDGFHVLPYRNRFHK